MLDRSKEIGGFKNGEFLAGSGTTYYGGSPCQMGTDGYLAPCTSDISGTSKFIGVFANSNLWDWFQQVTLRGAFTYRMDVQIRHLDLEGRTALRTWHLDRALPVKFKSSDLNAKGAEIAVEELHLVHEGLELRP